MNEPSQGNRGRLKRHIKSEDSEWITIRSSKVSRSKPVTMKIGSQLTPSCQRAPVEVWELILEYATHLPKELGIAEWTGDYDKLELGRNYVSRLAASSTDLQIELQNRYNLFRVSRGWNKTMLSALYKSIFVNDLSQMRRVHQQIINRPNIRPLIRRIDVGNLDQNEYNHAITLLREIVEICPNLACLLDSRSVIGNFISHFTACIHRESSHPNHSIQQLEYYQDSNSTLSSTTFSNLRALLLGGSIMDRISGDALSLPRLEILAVPQFNGVYDVLDEYISKCHFPRLHSLIIGLDGSAGGVFLKKLSLQLRTLRVIDKSRCWSRPIYTNNIVLETASLCVRLEQLIIPAWTHETILSKFGRLPSIRLLELTHTGVNTHVSPRKYFLQNNITNIFPRIRSLRISGIPTLTAIWEDEVVGVRRWIDYMDTYEDTMRSNGINIQISTGNGRLILLKGRAQGVL